MSTHNVCFYGEILSQNYHQILLLSKSSVKSSKKTKLQVLTFHMQFPTGDLTQSLMPSAREHLPKLNMPVPLYSV